MKKIIIFILIFSILFLSIDFTTDVDYSSFDFVSWEAIQKNQLKLKIIDISKKFKQETVSDEMINTMNLFPTDERWIVKKYSNNDVYTFDNDDQIYFNTQAAFSGFSKMKVNEKDFGTIIYQDKKNMLALTSIYFEVFHKNTLVNKKILESDSKGSDYQRLIDVQGEWITVLGWVNAKMDSPQPNYLAYMKIYRYNLLTKKVDIYSSLDNNVFVAPPDHGTEPVTPASHDISYDHRYIYIPGVKTMTGYTGEFKIGASTDSPLVTFYEFGDRKYKVIPGLYVFDWWTLKLYKILKEDVIAVINNTDDGYVYIQTDSKRDDVDFLYYRFKNPEAMLNEMGNK